MLRSTHQPRSSADDARPLPTGWTAHRAPTGHQYYYNITTKQSTYTRPSAQSATSGPPNPLVGNLGVNPFEPVFQGPLASLNSDSLAQQRQQIGGQHRNRVGSRQTKSHGRNWRRSRLEDGPKSKHPLPGCSPWLLIKTRLGRRFVHNPVTNESFWKFPEEVKRGVFEYDRLEKHGGVMDNATAFRSADIQPSGISAQRGDIDGLRVDEYEHVEVTDDENNIRASTPESQGRGEGTYRVDQVIEFNEDDFEYQLAGMERDHELYHGAYNENEGYSPIRDAETAVDPVAEDARVLFYELLDDHHINPFSNWDSVIADGWIVEDHRYTILPSTKLRKQAFLDWSRYRIRTVKAQRGSAAPMDPRASYLDFLAANARPNLFWTEFRRKHRKAPELRDSKLSDRERERLYREHVSRLKLPTSTRKADLLDLLRSFTPSELNRSSSLDGLPPTLLSDVRYISLPPQIRDAIIETYIGGLVPEPTAGGLSPKEKADEARTREVDQTGDKALAEREKRVAQDKRRQKRDVEASKERLEEEERKVKEAMAIGKEGLKTQLLITEADERIIQG